MPRDNHDLRELPYLCSKKVKIIMRRVLLASLITFHFSLFTSSAQTLEECQQAAEKNYPLIQQYDLIGKTTNLTVANIQKGWLPQISASVQATYQSDVTAWPEQMEGMMRQMGIDMVGLKKDQYRVGIDVSQTVYDGGVISSQKEIARKQGEVQKAQTEVNIYKVRKRVNEMYFGLLLINEQIRLNQDLQDVLGTQEKKLSSMLKNGTAAESDYNTVKAERLNVAQQATSLNAQRRSLTRMLSVFCGIRIESGEFLDEPSGIAERRVENDDSLELRTESLEFPTGLQTGSEQASDPSADSRAVANSTLSTLNSPLPSRAVANSTLSTLNSKLPSRAVANSKLYTLNSTLSTVHSPLQRPELKAIDAQLRLTDAKKKALNTALMPKLGVFAQGFYGYPGLNLFEDMQRHQWSLNGIVGARLTWNIGALYTRKNDKAALQTQRSMLNVQRDVFLFDNNLEQIGQNENIERYRKLMADDDEIIALRSAVRKAAESKLSHGIIDVNDLVREIHAENAARVQQSVHEIEMLKEIYNLRYTLGIEN